MLYRIQSEMGEGRGSTSIPARFGNVDVFHIAPLAMAILRPRDLRFVDVNPAFTKLFGWAADEAVGRTALELALFANDGTLPMPTGPDSSGSLRNVEMLTIGRDGVTREAIVSTALVEVHGETHAFVTFVDITDRKRAE